MKSKLLSRKFRLQGGVVAAGAALLLASAWLSAQSYSHARIVRLSFTEGTVSVERPGSGQWTEAPPNTPIEEGFKVSTAADSFAEFEFENSSTARVGEQSELDFTELALAPTGAKINRMALEGGYGTFTIIEERGDVYEVAAGQATLTPSGNATFRVDLDQSAERVEVFKGFVNVTSPEGSSQLSMDDVLEIQPGADEAYVVTRGITRDDWDEWVQNRQQVLGAQYSRAGASTVNLYPAYSSMYGWNDLSYYGDWSFVPGYGYGWSPFAAAGWMPYSCGQWAWYPGFGWTWVSSEPWGWMPFHYGSWSFVAGSGWFWFPGNLGSWSPAQVTWYQGNGWVGWRPGTNGMQPACPSGTNCTVVVGATTFRTGRPINAGDILRVQPEHGQMVPGPNVSPGEFAGVTGVAVNSSTVTTATGSTRAGMRTFTRMNGSGVAEVGSGTNNVVIGRRAGIGARAPSVVLQKAAEVGTETPAAARSGIMFDPQSRRFVNNPNNGPATIDGVSRENIQIQSVPARTLAPATTGTTSVSAVGSLSSGAAPPTTKPEHHFLGLWGGNRSAENSGKTSAESGIGVRGNAASTSGEMRAGRPSLAPHQVSAPRSQPSFSRQSSPSFGGGSSSGGGRMSIGGGGGGMRSEGGGHSAQPANAGHPH